MGTKVTHGQDDSTCNIQQCWKLLGNNVASVWTPCCMLLDVVACCCAKFVTGQTFQATTLNISFVPWSPKRSATMLDPFAQLFQHCWGHARSLRMVYKDLWVVSFPRCTAGPNIVGSCCIRLHTTANTHATTSNIVGATMLGPFAHSLRSLINPSSQVKDSSIMRVKIARILSFSWRRRTKKTSQSHTTRFAFVFVHLWLSYREKQKIPLY